MPGTAATRLALAELFTAYRADRWREFGNARDRMPEDNLAAQALRSTKP